MTSVSLQPDRTDACSPAGRVTRSLLGYGVLAGPTYVLVVLAQALLRDGYDPTHHDASLLANGGAGWVQIASFVVTGAMVVAGAFGIGRATGSRLLGALVLGYGVGLVAAGVFVADPAMGFPPGTPDGPGDVTVHGLFHMAAGAVGFTCLVAACFVHGRQQARAGRSGRALYSRVSGAVFALSFGGITSGSAAALVVLAFTFGVVAAWAWLSVTSAQLYSETR